MREKLQLYTNKTENLNDIGNAQNMNSHIHGDRIYLHEFCPQVEAKLVLQLLNTMTAALPPPRPPLRWESFFLYLFRNFWQWEASP